MNEECTTLKKNQLHTGMHSNKLTSILLAACFTLILLIPFGVYSQLDSAVKPPMAGYAFDKHSTFNIYGHSVIGNKLLDTTSLAKDVVRKSSKEPAGFDSDWLMFDSFWKEEKGRETIYELLEFTLLYTDWERYQRGTVNKKDLKYLRVLAERMLLYHEKGAHIADLIKEKRFSNSSGTAFLTSILHQLKWPFEIRRYEDHLYIVILGENDKYILDCMHLEKIWKCGKDDKKYLKALESESFEDRPVSMNTFLDRSTILSFQQLVALQKVSESEQLKKNDLYSAIERLEVAYYFWPQDEILENLRETCRTLFNLNDHTNNWCKLYAAAKYIQMTQDDSEITKSQFNLLLGNTLLWYADNEQTSLGYPPTMNIQVKNSPFGLKAIPIQDTLNLIGGFDYDQYVGFQLVEEKMRGFFHSLRFASSKESSGGSDYQFYIDALYIYSYLDHSPAFLKSICSIPISDYGHYSSILYDLLAHLKGGAIDSLVYHEMCAIFCLTHLSTKAPKSVSEAEIINMTSLIYESHLNDLEQHMKYIDNPDLLAEVKQYVLTVLPIYTQKFLQLGLETVKNIGASCGVE